MPAIRRDLAKFTTAGAAQEEAMQAQATRALATGMPTAPIERWLSRTDQALATLRTLSRSAGRAECYWVTRDMARVALDAAHDIPVLSWQDRPAPDGLLGVEAGLPQIQGQSVDGIWWSTTDTGTLLIQLLQRVPPSRSPALPQVRYLMPTHSREISLDEAIDLDETSLAVGSWLAATWTLMMTPTVAQRRSLDARTGQQATAQTPAREEVSIIDLRPLRQVHTEHDPHTGRRLTVRHLVRGHWRYQAHGPGRAQHHLTYIAPYIKGPTHAPLKLTERVYTWRR